MHALLFTLAAVTGDIQHEAVYEAEHADPWVHQRTRLHLLSKSEDAELGKSGVLWGYEAGAFVQHDAGQNVDDDDRNEARVENLFVRAYQDAWNARVGWQTVNWGETLGPSLIDVINPRDLRDPSYWLKADHKLAVPLILVGWSRDNALIDAWVTPRTPQSLLPDDWRGLPLDNNDRQTIPEYGVRAGTRLGGWDMKVYAMRHRARLPALSVTVQDLQPRLDATFPLESTFGFTLSQAWDNLVLRSEYTHSETKDWSKDGLLDEAPDQAVIGLDGTAGDHFFWAGEVRYQDAGWVIAQGRWNLFSDRLKPVIYLMQRIDDYDAYQRYEISADLPHNWNAAISWEAFQSGKEGYFTQLLAYDRLGLNVRWEF